MGTFEGHAWPGSLYVIVGVWWLVQGTRQKIYQGRHYRSTSFCKLLTIRGMPIEPVVKIIVTSLGMLFEVLASTDWLNKGQVVFLGDIQHVTMFLFFFLSGVCDLMRWYRVKAVPKDSEYVCLALAFLVEGLIFRFHLHGRNELNVHVHILLVYLILGCFIATVYEMSHKDNILFFYIRSILTILQGTWFWQVGVILFGFMNFGNWQAIIYRDPAFHLEKLNSNDRFSKGYFAYIANRTGNRRLPSESRLQEVVLKELNEENFLFATLTFFWHIAIVTVCSVLIIAITQHLVSRRKLHLTAGKDNDIEDHEDEVVLYDRLPTEDDGLGHDNNNALDP